METLIDMNCDDIFAPFTNEISELPPPNAYVRKKHLEVPEELQEELDKTNNMRENDFRSWLIKNKPKDALMTPIETNTAAGVPDIFCCYHGFSSWVECKSLTATQQGRIRGTQYAYLKKLYKAGGHSKVVIQRIAPSTYKPSTIEIFEGNYIANMPIGLFKISGKELLFPARIEPWYKWHYNDKTSIDELYLRLLLDTKEFEC